MEVVAMACKCKSGLGGFGMVLGIAAGVALLAGLLVGLTGCEYSERYSYASDAWSPKTVSVVDTTTGAKIVSVDVPVGQQLNMEFDQLKTHSEAAGTTTLRYALKPAGDNSIAKGSQIEVPPPSARRIDVTERPKPELPPKK
jgi:hypothetical protein